MATKVKLTISINRDLVKELDEETKTRKTSRSALVEEGIKLLKKKRMEDALKSGYQAMAEENLKVAEETIAYGSEVLNEK